MPLTELVPLLRQINTVPEGFSAHDKIRRLLLQRAAMVEGNKMFVPEYDDDFTEPDAEGESQ